MNQNVMNISTDNNVVLEKNNNVSLTYSLFFISYGHYLLRKQEITLLLKCEAQRQEKMLKTET
jgi:hypothetical protein